MAIEIKSSEQVKTKHKSGLKAFKEEHPDCRLILVSLDPITRMSGDVELLTVSESIKALSIGGASSLGIEKDHGSIKIGKYADFVVLDQDLFELEKQNKPQDIFKTNIESTWFEGRKVFPLK